MGFALRQQQPRRSDSARTTPVCRVHTCLRCKISISSNEPCSFVFSMYRVCGPCAGQEQVLAHLPKARPSTIWGAGLASVRRV